MAWTVKKPSGKFQGLYRDASGKVKSAGMHLRESDARLAASHKEAIARKDAFVLSELTFQEWYDEWFPKRRVARLTQDEDRKRFENRILPRFGGKRISEIDYSMLNDWVGEMLSDELSPSTVQKHVHNLSAAMKAAVLERMIPANPCVGVKLPDRDPTPDRYLSRPEANAVVNLLHGLNVLIWEVLIGTGARWSEAVALHWDHIDFQNQRIEIVLSWDRRNKVFTSTKNRRRRFVPMSNHLTEILRAHLQEHGYGKPTPFKYEPKSLKPRHGVVLCGPTGMPTPPTNFSHAIDAAGEAARVKDDNGVEVAVGHIRPHDLRHTYASWLLQDGVPIEVVSKLLGHSSVVVTERYARLGNQTWDPVRKSLNI